MAKSSDIKQSKSSKSAGKAAESAKAKAASFQQKLKQLGIKQRSKKKLWVWMGSGVVAVIVIALVTFGVLIYKYKQTNGAVAAAAQIIPYPVVSVNGSPLWNVATYHQYLFELASVKKYLQYQGTDINSADGKQQLESMKKDILTRLQNNIIYAQGARKYNISVDQKEIDDEYNKIVQEAGGPDKVKTTLDQLYGWTIADFKNKIRDGLLQQKLGDFIAKDDKLNATAKQQSDDVIKQLQGGADFGELAKKYSTDGYASNGGDLGFISKGQLGEPELENAAFSLETGKVSDVIKTQYGYHIIKVTEKKDDQVRVSQILIKSVDLDSWLHDQTSKSKISTYLKV